MMSQDIGDIGHEAIELTLELLFGLCGLLLRQVLLHGLVESFYFSAGLGAVRPRVLREEAEREELDHAPEGSAPLLGGFIHDMSFVRLAITPEQAEEMQLEWHATTREGNQHAVNFEGDSIEVVAIAPNTLTDMVWEAILDHLNADALDRLSEEEEVAEGARTVRHEPCVDTGYRCMCLGRMVDRRIP
jgi:hypothetical protein